MTISANIVEAIVTIPPLGKSFRDESGNEIIEGEKYRIYVLAVPPGWESMTAGTFDCFTIGVLTGVGKTSEPYKSRVKVILPSGYKVIALPFDDKGSPITTESYHVALNVDDEHAFEVKEAEVFINDALISGSIIAAADVNLEAWRQEVQCRFDQQSASIASLEASIGEMVKDAIRRELQPGGVLHAAWRGRV